MIFLDLVVTPGFSPDMLKKAASAALDQAANPAFDLTIVLTGDEEIHKLNRDFLGKDSPTDVLSFPAAEVDPETGRQYLGDVVISLPRAKEQALAHGHDVSIEVQLLVVHGVLHLLGYDHGNKGEKALMWKVQGEVLKKLGVKLDEIEE